MPGNAVRASAGLCEAQARRLEGAGSSGGNIYAR